MTLSLFPPMPLPLPLPLTLLLLPLADFGAMLGSPGDLDSGDTDSACGSNSSPLLLLKDDEE